MAVNLENIAEETSIGTADNKVYSLFSEQFLENPDRYELGTGPSVCTIKKIPCFDDW